MEKWMMKWVVVIVSIIALTAYGVSLEERVTSMLEIKFNTLLEVSYAEADQSFNLQIINEQLSLK